MPSKTFTKWKSIKLVDCIAESHLIGTTKIDVLTSPCQDKPRNNSKSMNTFKKDHLKIACFQVVSMIYYAWAVYIALLMTLNTKAAEQSKSTEFTMDTVEELLD